MSFKIDINTAKILVVDDEREITEIVETFLLDAGYQVAVENSSEKAVKRAQEFKPNVILLDIMMPGQDGYNICKEIKADSEFASTPIIFLTGKDRSDDMGRSFKSGGDMFIKKPFSCERLLEIVNIVLMSANRH
ncbi:MAG: PleD family two-component system response regulator [Candidatus Zixiibacteriota bacterium]